MKKNNIIHAECPECHNMKFLILQVMAKSKAYKEKTSTGSSMNFTAGYYRAQCCACGFIETFKSKNPEP